MLELTSEQQVQRNYSASMDSVNLLLAGKPEKMTDEEWADTVKRNKEHLEIQIAKGDYYVGFDLTPFEDAVK
jgi:lipopolysaccharide biosynthesis regulator YciM